MKKMFMLAFVLALALSACTITSKEEVAYNKACFDIGGTLGRDGCVLPESPDCVCPVCVTAQPETAQPVKEAQVIQCDADIVGIPVEVAGECKFCTINYVYDPAGQNPGDVYIVGSEPMEYKIGAYVYQYLYPEDFKACIMGQDFYSDPGYTPVWVESD